MCRREFITHVYPGDRYVRQPYLILCNRSRDGRPCSNFREYDLGVRYHNSTSSTTGIPAPMESSTPSPPPRQSGGVWIPHRRPSVTQQSQLPRLRVDVPAERRGDPSNVQTMQPQQIRPTETRRDIVLQQGGETTTPASARPRTGTYPPRSPTEQRHNPPSAGGTPQRQPTYQRKNGQYTPPSNDPHSLGHRRGASSGGSHRPIVRPGGEATIQSPPDSPHGLPTGAAGQGDQDPEVTRGDYRAERRAANQRTSWASDDSEVAELRRQLDAKDAEIKKLKSDNRRSFESTPSVESRLKELEEQMSTLSSEAQTKQKVETARRYIADQRSPKKRSPTTPRQEFYHDGTIQERQPPRTGDAQASRAPAKKKSDERTSAKSRSNRSSLIVDETQEEDDGVDEPSEKSDRRRRRVRKDRGDDDGKKDKKRDDKKDRR